MGGGARAYNKIRFYLLGAKNTNNPSCINEREIIRWENEGIIKHFDEVLDVREFIANATCIVLPSYKEGAPRSLLEAMAMGKPIITTNTSGCKNLLYNGINGFICEPKDAKSLYLAMREFISLDSTKQALLGENAREIAISKYDMTITIQTYLKTLDRELKQNRV